MPALTVFGRISAISLFAAIQAVSQTPSTSAAPQPPASNFAATAPAGAPQGVTVEVPSLAPADEQDGDLFMVQEKYQAALDAYSKIAQQSAELFDKMGIAHQMLYDSKSAVRCYKESLKLDPRSPSALNNLATIEDARKNFSAAERLFRKALNTNPANARIMKNLGTNLLMQHKYRESFKVYSQALALDPHILDPVPGPTTQTPVSVQDHGIESYLKARSCARAGLSDCAITHLRMAFDEGSATMEQVANDNDFEVLRETPAFERLLAEQR
jgi:tetratricopeptide (TPR) repeat protein